MTAPTPHQTALAPWFGGKRTLAPRILAALGEHSVYWEPFCGSMAVLLNKPPAKMETVNDLHGDLVNLARVVADESAAVKLYSRLARTIFAEGLFRESLCLVRSEPVPDPDAAELLRVARAYHYFIVSWMGMGGTAGICARGTNFARRFSSAGGAPGRRFVGAVESIPWWHQRLREVAILSTDGIELCERIEDKDGTAIYADPPYLEKGATYLHDFTRSDRSGGPSLFGGAGDDHERLALALRRLRSTKVVVSYYEHPDLAALYPGWEKIPVTVAKSMVNSGERTEGRTDAPEVLIVNRKAV